VDEARPGDLLEVRVPMGGYFVWDAPSGGPLVLVVGGSGLVPLGAIARHRPAVSPSVPAGFLYSGGRLDEAIYTSVIEGLIEVI
jgi:ferredoxin-NADP reductase